MRDDRSPDHVDALIDDVARSMTEAPPPISLRAAVRARIDDRPAWRVRIWRVGLVATAGALATIVGAAMFSRLDDSASRPAARAERIVPTAPPAPRRAEAVTMAVPDGTGGRSRPLTATDRGTPLPPAPALTVAPIDVSPLAEAPLHLEVIEAPMPLRADRLQIDPLVFR